MKCLRFEFGVRFALVGVMILYRLVGVLLIAARCWFGVALQGDYRGVEIQ